MDGAQRYNNLLERCAKIDRRHDRYRFDLETDVAWDRLDAPGRYFPDSYLRAVGLLPDVLATNPQAAELMQWALALSTAVTFLELEEDVLAVTRGIQKADFTGCRSITLLDEEEEKHIELFRRYARYLESVHPDLVPRFTELIALSSYMRGRDIEGAADAPELAAIKHARGTAFPTNAPQHYRFWLCTMFFEEYTVYLHDCLTAASEEIQPAWASAHAMHRQEEIQHIVTDVHMIDATNITDAQRRMESIMHVVQLAKIFRFYSAIDAPCRLVRALFPALPPFEDERPFLKSPFVEVIRTEKAFAHTRALPGWSFP
jgi:hypothetical protein